LQAFPYQADPNTVKYPCRGAPDLQKGYWGLHTHGEASIHPVFKICAPQIENGFAVVTIVYMSANNVVKELPKGKNF
jgi:hypothetical protein